MPSRLPHSSQDGIHESLARTVDRHLTHAWRQPIRAHSLQAFESICPRASTAPALILDAGCGTGWSTAKLAEAHPEALVLGIDRSEYRLAKAPPLPGNAVLLRAELSDVWRLARQAGWRLDAHYLLYPNPWPKARHLQRRWHGHAVFPDLLALGGRLELRSNFRLYVEEFLAALRLAGVGGGEVVSFRPESPISPFEAKYAASGHELFRLTVHLETTE
jgi:tRNA G46 methylase TrmB